MCSYKLLVHKKSGYIIKCNGCTHYQVAFGTTLFSLQSEEFKPFFHQVNELKMITVPNGFPEQKRIRVELPCCNSSMMVLNLNELGSLHALMEEAVVADEVNELLSNNNLTSLS